MRPLLFVLVVSAVAACLAAGAGSARVDIVCRPFGNAPKLSVLCVLIGSDNHIRGGTFLVLLSDHGLIVAAARNGSPATVFQRVHGR
jgi:hypothetical protein